MKKQSPVNNTNAAEPGFNPPVMKNILVFRKHFFIPTETFIYHQVSFLKDSFKIHLVASKYSDGKRHDFTKLNRVRLWRGERILRKTLYKISGNIIEEKYLFFHSYQIQRLIKREKIGLIHAHFGKDALRILPVAKKSQVPLVVSFHGYDASGSLRHPYYKSQLPNLFDYASKIIIVSKHMMESLGLEKWQDKVLLLPYGINTEDFKPLAKKRFQKNLVILHSGRIVNKKGVPDLIEVFARVHAKHPETQLRVLGDGPELDRCKQMVTALTLQDAVIFMGAQPHHVVKEELNEADIFVLNSRVDEKGNMEGTPVSLLEAMSMAKAVVSTYHAGIPDVVANGINGLLVAEKDNAALESAVSSLVQDEQLRKTMGNAARQTVLENYAHGRLFSQLQQALSNVLEIAG